jgi:hypothetical protein
MKRFRTLRALFAFAALVLFGCVPTVTASSIAYSDEDPRQGFTGGTVVIQPASDESNVLTYDLYWGSSTATKLPGQPRIASLPKTGAALSYVVPPGTVVPAGATAFVVFTANASGEDPFGIGTAPVDNYAHFVDISAGAPPQSGLRPSIVFQIDTIPYTLQVATEDGSNGFRPSLFRCHVDGSAATYQDISAGTAAGSGYYPSAAIGAHGGLRVAATNNTVGELGLFLCGRDGTGCTYSDVAAQIPAGVATGLTPALYADVTTQRLITAVRALDTVALDVCADDGTGCTSVSPGFGFAPTVAADVGVTAQALFVGAWMNPMSSPNGTLRVYVCPLATLTPCSLITTGFEPSGDSSSDQRIPRAVVAYDIVHDNVLVVGVHDTGPKLYLASASGLIAGAVTSFVEVDLPEGVGMVPPFNLIADRFTQKVYVVGNRDGQLGMLRCELDGSACSYVDLSAGQPPNSGTFPSSTYDPKREVLYVATDDAANGDRVGLFWIGLW